MVLKSCRNDISLNSHVLELNTTSEMCVRLRAFEMQSYKVLSSLNLFVKLMETKAAWVEAEDIELIVRLSLHCNLCS